MKEYLKKIDRLKKEKNAVILAHTYQPGEVQDIADYVGDSYGLSVKAAETDADTIIFCGVMFMAETAAILNPYKKVIIPDSRAGCPMADMITAEELKELKAEHPEHIVMCYVNSTAEVKALSDVCCTSSNALKIVQKLPKERGVIFVPDKYLGSWVQEKTGREMILWEGFCPTHMFITSEMIKQAKTEHPGAPVLIHPEAHKTARDLADEVLSTGGMCTYVKESSKTAFIIATETGIVHTLKKQNPGKSFYTLSKKIICPNMKRISVESVVLALEGAGGMSVTVPDKIAAHAKTSLLKMLEMSR